MWQIDFHVYSQVGETSAMGNEKHLTHLKQGVVNILDKAYQAVASGAAYVCTWAKTWITERQAGDSIRRTRQQVMAHLRSTSWQEVTRQSLPLLVGLGVLLLLFALWKLPQWYAASWDKLTDPKDIAKLESDTRTTLVQAVGGLALFWGLFFTAKTWRTTQEGQITDRFTKAIAQLGEQGPEKLAVRLGGIYALERIARDSERDHWPIMEILTAYVRENAPWKEEEQRSTEEISPCETQPTQSFQSPPKLTTDIQAILTVLGRCARTFGKGKGQHLDLRRTALRGADLRGAHLEMTFLSMKTLYQAQLDPALREQVQQRYPHLLEEPQG